MKWIAHRGNINGPNFLMENNPQYVRKTLEAGYDVEIDVWFEFGDIYLGHDKPQYKINRYFLQNQRVWAHCKNIKTYIELSKFININCFLQDAEELVSTTRGYIWAHSKSTAWNNKTVITKLDSRNWNAPDDIFAICSDYVGDPDFKLPFDLLIIDIDGIMTDGTKMYDKDGKVFGKNYCDLDFTAIKRFIAAGIKVCFLSGDQNINMAMAKTRKIPFFYNPPGTDKTEILSSIKRNFNNVNRIAYIGDDYYDIAIMNSVDFSFCPKTSPTVVKNIASVINVDAGKGVIAGLYDELEKQIPYVFPVDSIDVNPK